MRGAMSTRSIVIFPTFRNVAVIDRLRKQFDPLAAKIRPHITLVFPFESGISKNALRAEVARCVADTAPFCMVLSGITGHVGEYLFLNFREGTDQVVLLHDRLYAGALAPFLNKTIPYQPRLTIGRLHDAASFAEALSEVESVRKEFACIVESVVIERVLSDETSEVESEVMLTKANR